MEEEEGLARSRRREQISASCILVCAETLHSDELMAVLHSMEFMFHVAYFGQL